MQAFIQFDLNLIHFLPSFRGLCRHYPNYGKDDSHECNSTNQGIADSRINQLFLVAKVVEHTQCKLTVTDEEQAYKYRKDGLAFPKIVNLETVRSVKVFQDFEFIRVSDIWSICLVCHRHFVFGCLPIPRTER